jgi:hypothetical protein
MVGALSAVGRMGIIRMKILKTLSSAGICAAVLAALGAKAEAAAIPVADPYFNMFPAGQSAATYLNFSDCANPGCAFSDSAVVGWTDSVTTFTRGANEGQWQIGQLPSTNTFNSDPTAGEPIVLRAINATASQIVSTTAVAGATYTLNVDLGFAKTQEDNASVILIVDGHQVTAAPLASDGLTQNQMQETGNWYDFEASYTATAVDAGAPIEILLSSLTNGIGWGFFGNVQLTDSVPAVSPVATPEPATWTMLLIGFGGMAGAAAVRRSFGRRSAGQSA